MKKKYMLVAITLVVPSIALASQTQNREMQADVSGSAVSTEVAPTQSASVQSQNRNEVQEQTRENNPATGAMVEENTQTRSEDQDEQMLGLTQGTQSSQRRSQVASATQSLIDASYQLENKGLGDQIRTLAQEQERDYLEVESSLEQISSRSSFAKFFIGPNFSKIKATEKLLNQYKNQVAQMSQIQTSLANEGDYQNIASSIEFIDSQISVLEEELQNSQKGFSLFGWLGRLLNK
ncbi:MAG: hypothetical protein BWY43_00301 [candidate division WS2 bacterium ADurb.Bin280]|uniref:DUF5667 domain-containing protein n=1 Tax=candidate division WS2 bacterium ADurb.Bin280 TaxID=1852829 RepID=A0A1V5SEH0_9BACT|nr:MAG: hypothetical protein BWY43_00301 [candidate division WS2 bacterium ADurb.Bin280]